MRRAGRLRILIASGPTREPLDPVRYLSNYSTGKMGACLAEAARQRRHRVTWVECPDQAPTARDLLKKLRGLLPGQDVLIMAAAVCDARPVRVSARKIKKNAFSSIRLVKNPDVAAALGRRKKRRQYFIGFGLESADLRKNGLKKLKEKNLDLIVLQRVTKKDAPFGDRSIEAVVLNKNKAAKRFRSVSKRRLARYLIQEAEQNRLSKKSDA